MARGATIQSDLVEKRRKINEIIDMPVIYEVLKAIFSSTVVTRLKLSIIVIRSNLDFMQHYSMKLLMLLASAKKQLCIISIHGELLKH